MKVFVTGGTGLIGSRLILALMRRHDQVVCLSRTPDKAHSKLPVGVEIVAGDPSVAGDWQAAVAGCDAVVNLAGESVAKGIWTERRKKLIRRSRLDTTRNVIEAIGLAEPACSVLVNASATGYYGDSGAAALDESCEPGPGFLARLTREWESTALQAESSRTRVVVLRIGIVLALEGGALPRMMLPFKFGLGGSLGSGRQYFPWIHIEDVVRIVLFALDDVELRGPVNATAPDPPTQAAFARALGAVMRRPSFFVVPGFLLRTLWGEKGDMILASQRVIPKALRARGFHFKFDSLHEALNDLLAPSVQSSG